MFRKIRSLVTICAVVGLIVAVSGTAQANWEETFDNNDFDLPTWEFHCYPDMTGTFSGTIQDGPGSDDYLSIDETSPAAAGGSQIGAGFGSDEVFTDVRVGAVFNVIGDASLNYHGMTARTTYIIVPPPPNPPVYPGIIASCYLMLIHYEEGPENLKIELMKVVNNQTDIMETWQPEVPVPGIDHARSRYVQLDVVGSDPVYITGSIYEYKGGPLLVRTPTFIDTSANDPWEKAGIHDDVFASGVSGIFAMWESPQPAGYHTTFDSVFSISDGPEAVNPYPADGATDVPIDVDLSWVEAEFATSRDLWLGKQGAMEKVTPPPAGTTYDPPVTLELGQTYEWRVDQIGSKVTGRVWTFTTGEYLLLVDDMESYTDRVSIETIWKDGYVCVDWGDPPEVPPVTGGCSGSVVDVASGVGGGSQAMVFNYDNDGETFVPGYSGWRYPAPYYSEIEARTSGPNSLGITTDWAAAGVKALRLYFYGAPDNDANEQMYVVLEDGDMPSHSKMVPYDGDMNDVKVEAWQQWNIDLEEFTNVNLSDVAKIYIGFGVRDNPTTPGGSGVVYFDNIRLYPSMCVPGRGKPEADINNDCVVNYKDLDMLAEDWLSDSNDEGLWYEYFEGTWDALPDFDLLTPVKVDRINSFDITPRDQNDYFGFRFSGKISLFTPGSYTFYTTSDDGSKLFIGDIQVVDNDGTHSMQERSGTISLSAGRHPITVTMFEKDGQEGLEVRYEGPGIAKTLIPDDVLYRPSDLYEDTKVDFKDYAKLAEEWLDELFWP